MLRLHPKKPTITESKSVSFSLDDPDIPSTSEHSPRNFSEIPDCNSEDYYTRDARLRRQPILYTTVKNFGFKNDAPLKIYTDHIFNTQNHSSRFS